MKMTVIIYTICDKSRLMSSKFSSAMAHSTEPGDITQQIIIKTSTYRKLPPHPFFPKNPHTELPKDKILPLDFQKQKERNKFAFCSLMQLPL